MDTTIQLGILVWGVFAAICAICFWAGILTQKVSQHNKEIGKLFDLVGKKYDTLVDKMDQSSRELHARIDTLYGSSAKK